VKAVSARVVARCGVGLFLLTTTLSAQTLHAFRHDRGLTLNFSHTNAGQFTVYEGTNVFLESPTNNPYRSFSIEFATDKPMALYTVRSAGAPAVEQQMVIAGPEPIYGPWPQTLPGVPTK
jgi:hypothetical protein